MTDSILDSHFPTWNIKRTNIAQSVDKFHPLPESTRVLVTPRERFARRKPETIERLYLDFDGFFASVEQQADRRLRGRPVGVVPFAGTHRTCIIACSKEAKMRGVSNVMGIRDAKALCPDIILVPQKPDLYRRAHNALLAEIEAVIPLDAVKSIDELTCRLDEEQRSEPEKLAVRLRERLANNIGPFITCSIGMAANRQLEKMACKSGQAIQWHLWKWPHHLEAAGYARSSLPDKA